MDLDFRSEKELSREDFREDERTTDDYHTRCGIRRSSYCTTTYTSHPNEHLTPHSSQSVEHSTNQQTNLHNQTQYYLSIVLKHQIIPIQFKTTHRSRHPSCHRFHRLLLSLTSILSSFKGQMTLRTRSTSVSQQRSSKTKEIPNQQLYPQIKFKLSAFHSCLVYISPSTFSFSFLPILPPSVHTPTPTHARTRTRTRLPYYPSISFLGIFSYIHADIHTFNLLGDLRISFTVLLLSYPPLATLRANCKNVCTPKLNKSFMGDNIDLEVIDFYIIHFIDNVLHF
jgi:hypothetical protein